MTNKTLRQKISEILIKWSMPTRQAAIIEIENLLKGQLSEIVGEVEATKQTMKNFPIVMPPSMNPDRMEDVIYCAEHNIADAYNNSKDEVIALIKKRIG